MGFGGERFAGEDHAWAGASSAFGDAARASLLDEKGAVGTEAGDCDGFWVEIWGKRCVRSAIGWDLERWFDLGLWGWEREREREGGKSTHRLSVQWHSTDIAMTGLEWCCKKSPKLPG